MQIGTKKNILVLKDKSFQKWLSFKLRDLQKEKSFKKKKILKTYNIIFYLKLTENFLYSL